MNPFPVSNLIRYTLQTMSVPLTKVDSAIAGLSISDEKPEIQKEVKAKTHRRASSTVEGVWNIKDLGKNIIKSQWRKLY